jgi:2-amino-4-hydroxy-6-hydroxymethyldihydropteridine diphosphokinase
MRAFIGLGSNLAEPLLQIHLALLALQQHPDIQACKSSRLYLSRPLGPADQADYINAVASIETTLTAHRCLDILEAIEIQQGRKRNAIHWGPRTLDLDLLLYGDQVINSPRLIVPHPELTKRNFVLYPLAELAPELILPNGSAMCDLLKNCSNEGLQVIKTSSDCCPWQNLSHIKNPSTMPTLC